MRARHTLRRHLERAAFRAVVIAWAVWWPMVLWARFVA